MNGEGTTATIKNTMLPITEKKNNQRHKPTLTPNGVIKYMTKEKHKRHESYR